MTAAKLHARRWAAGREAYSAAVLRLIRLEEERLAAVVSYAHLSLNSCPFLTPLLPLASASPAPRPHAALRHTRQTLEIGKGQSRPMAPGLVVVTAGTVGISSDDPRDKPRTLVAGQHYGEVGGRASFALPPRPHLRLRGAALRRPCCALRRRRASRPAPRQPHASQEMLLYDDAHTYTLKATKGDAVRCCRHVHALRSSPPAAADGHATQHQRPCSPAAPPALALTRRLLLRAARFLALVSRRWSTC